MRRSGRCDIRQVPTEKVSFPFHQAIAADLDAKELESAADARERDREIAQLIQDGDAEDDIGEM